MGDDYLEGQEHSFALQTEPVMEPPPPWGLELAPQATPSVSSVGSKMSATPSQPPAQTLPTRPSTQVRTPLQVGTSSLVQPFSYLGPHVPPSPGLATQLGLDGDKVLQPRPLLFLSLSRTLSPDGHAANSLSPLRSCLCIEAMPAHGVPNSGPVTPGNISSGRSVVRTGVPYVVDLPSSWHLQVETYPLFPHYYILRAEGSAWHTVGVQSFLVT